MRGGTRKRKFIIESSSTERKPVGRLRKPTQKRRIIIESSSPMLLPVTPPKTKKGKAKSDVKRGQTKKKRFIIASSSTEEIKEKNESPKIEKKGQQKTDLKVSPDIKPMASIAQPLPSGRLNEKFIELMEKLADIMLKQGEPFRARAYQKAQETIMAFPDDILSPEQLAGKPGIGSTIMDKLTEYVQTGTLKVLEREKNNPINILADVYGIGPKKAKELVEKGVTTIAQLRENTQMLNDVQKVGLRYYEDILKRIPRSEIEEYESIFDTNFMFATLLKEPNDDPRFEVVGSYRRGAQNSGDIDVIITANDPKVFVRFIDTLIKQKIILEVLSRGPTKCLVIAKIPSSDSARRVDFLYSTPEEYPFSVLYFTGSKIFNTVMRHQALQMGLTMNEHGLYKMEGKKKERRSHIPSRMKRTFSTISIWHIRLP